MNVLLSLKTTFISFVNMWVRACVRACVRVCVCLCALGMGQNIRLFVPVGQHRFEHLDR